MVDHRIENETKAMKIADFLRADILNGVFEAGSRLTTKEICDRYGVSNVPVREALRTLESEKLVEISAYKLAARLLVSDELLEDSAADLESLITLEARLSEVRYEIESIERNLRNLDQKLAFSTVNLELREVEIYTPTVSVQRTFGEKLADAFSDGWNGFVRGLQRFILWFAEVLPALVLWALILGGAVLTFFGIRKRIRRKKQKEREEAQNNKQAE